MHKHLSSRPLANLEEGGAHVERRDRGRLARGQRRGKCLQMRHEVVCGGQREGRERPASRVRQAGWEAGKAAGGKEHDQAYARNGRAISLHREILPRRSLSLPLRMLTWHTTTRNDVTNKDSDGVCIVLRALRHNVPHVPRTIFPVSVCEPFSSGPPRSRRKAMVGLAVRGSAQSRHSTSCASAAVA